MINHATILKLTVLSVTAALSCNAHAEFMWLTTTFDTMTASDGAVLSRIRVYADFSSTNDRLLAIGHASVEGVEWLYQNPFGTSIEPPPPLIAVFPSLAFDSFVTIGLPTSPGAPPTQLQADFTFTPSGFAGGWFTSPTAAHATGHYSYLVAQITYEDMYYACPFGTMDIVWQPDGGRPTTSKGYVSFFLSCGQLWWWGDFDKDCDRDGLDLASLLAAWGECDEQPCLADLNGNGIVDGLDLAILLGLWGPSPPSFVCP